MNDELARWLDEYTLAGRGLLLATRDRRFWPPFLITFFVFGTLLNLLSNGFASFRLMAVSGFGGALKILGEAFLAIFGFGKSFGDWALNFALILCQSTLIALVVFVAKHNRKTRKSKSEDSDAKTSAALIAGLAVLGSGCPTCGTTLLTPVIGAIASGSASAAAFAGQLSMTLNAVAIVLAILVFHKLGLQTYAIIRSEKRSRKCKKPSESSSLSPSSD